MTPVVVDTDVVSFIFKRDTRSQLYIGDLRDRPAMISFMTEAELERWALVAAWGDARRAKLHEFLKNFLVIHSSKMLGEKWAEAMVGSQDSGKRIETADAWIAATALLYQAALITNNASDYRGVPGLQLISYGAFRNPRS